MEEEGTQNLRLLKAVVITLGILIIIMLGIIVGTVIYRLSQSGEDTAESLPPAPSAELEIPAGGSLRAMTPTDRELYLHVEDGAGNAHIYALDRRSGGLLWHRQLVPAQ